MPGDRDVIRAPKGMHDVLPPESDALAGARRALRDARRPVRLRPARHADLRALRGVRSSVGETHRRRAQGDVRLRRPGRPAARAARRRHRVGRARVRAAPPADAVEGLVRRAQLPRPSGRRRAATASTGRSASRCSASTTRRRRRGHRARATASTATISACAGSACSSTRWATPRRERATARCCSRTGATHATLLGDEMERAEANPLRILDSKRDRLAGHARARAADRRVPHRRGGRALRDACRTGCSALGIPFEIAPRLVRGLDYYTGTMFEFQSDALDAAQNAIGGGGRYDGLVEQMGGKPDAPAIGFGIGIERVLLVVRRRRRVRRAPSARSTCSSSTPSAASPGSRSLAELRAVGPLRRPRVRQPVDEEAVGRGRPSRARAGASSSAPRELADGKVAVKDLATGEQVEVRRDEVAAWLQTRRDDELLMMRTHRAGDLRAEHVGADVVVCGWVAHRRDHGGMVFLDVRDAAGLVQVVVDPEQAGLRGRAPRAQRVGAARRRRRCGPGPRARSTPTSRPARSRSVASSVEVLNEADPSPFPLDDRVDVDEVLRLRHRYLDLRRAPMQRNLRVRAEVNRAMREAMRAQGFVEVETPMLIASTPEGARDFVVPSRLRPGSFYALPQSPQLFKQLLMVGGLDRYFQIARCLRDEDLRADRQFEFMQLDIEMTLRRPGRRARRGVGRGARRGRGGAARRGAGDDPADDVARGDGALRLRQARHALRHGARRAHRGVRGDRVPAFAGAEAVKGIPGRRRGRHGALEARRADRPGEGARARPVWCGCACATAACSSRRS